MTTPDWFTRSLRAERAEATVEVDGCPIHYIRWGDPEEPGLVFVHGGAAHAEWWAHLAPMFTNHYSVVAVDLSGHGESGRRERYSHPQWAKEIVAVCGELTFPGPPVLVGHSLGGLVTIETASTYGGLLAGAVIIDAPVRKPDPESEEASRGRAFRSPGTYPDLETALEHFHLIPPQPDPEARVLDHVARNSLHETDEGWTWKFDPNLFTHTTVAMHEQLASVKCRVAVLRAEHSVVVPQDTAEYMYDLMGRVSPLVTIPEAHHHLLLDQPLSFVTALRTLLADWEHSVPFERQK